MIYNRIPVMVGGLRKINLPPIMYQYDQVQKLILTDIELPESFRADFCNEGDTATITMVGTADGVEIPNQLLQTGKPIKAFIVLNGIDANAVETRIDINIPVNKRPPASDIEPTPAEQTTIDTLIAAMNEAVEDAETAKQGAKDAQQAIENMTVSAETLAPGSDATVTKSIIEDVVHLLFGIPKGQPGEKGDPGTKGDTGNGIESITLISTVGLDKTYRIAYTNGDHFDYVVKDGAKGDTGNGIASIAKTGTSGKVDTYTITYTNGNTTTFTVTNGTDGEDGVSPAVTITTITGGHRVTITDADHPSGQSFDVMDGTNTDAEHVTYDSTQTYSSGTVGAGLNQLNSEINDTKDAIRYGANQIFADLSLWYRGYIGANGSFSSNNRTISPSNAPIKLDAGKTVVVTAGTLVGGIGLFRYNSETQKYSRYSTPDITGVTKIVSDGDNFYYALTFRYDPQSTIYPSAFDGFIGEYTDWREQIEINSTKLPADGMVQVFADLTQWNAGYFGSNGILSSTTYRCTPLSTPFLLYAGDTIEIDPGNYACGIATYSYNSGTYARQTSTTITEKTVITYDSDKYISFDFGKSPAGVSPKTDFTGTIRYSVTWKTKIFNNSSRISVLETAASSGNYLTGKKLVACGDSITAAVNPGGGNFDSYAKLAAQRNGMVFDVNAVSGSTMTNVAGRSPFCVDRYQNVPSDFDYLTIWFGYNDGAYAQVGTIEDTVDTTFYGAYKKVMDYFLTTYPTKKIGLIVPYMSDTAFQQAVRDISNMYGVPCLDLPDYNQCSILWGSGNAAQTARKNALTYDGTHPNQDGHYFLSTMYEQFLLRL